MQPNATHSPTSGAGPFSLFAVLRQRYSPTAAGAIAAVLDRALALPRLNAIYRQVASAPPDGQSIWDRALSALNVSVALDAGALDAIPRTGPLIVVANHPFGGIDGLCLVSVLHRVRPDVRAIGNQLLAQIPDLRESLIGVDAYGGPRAAQANRAAVRHGLRWLTDGYALAMFPAGDVSHVDWRWRTITDQPWRQTAARLAQVAGATIVPVFFHGANSRLFQMAGLVHPRLRTLLLPREILKRQRSVVRLSIGSPIPSGQVKRFDTVEHLTSYLRARTFVLRGRTESAAATRALTAPPQPLAPVTSGVALRRAVAGLSPDQRVVESAPYSVWLIERADAPVLVDEIGRLRELTFRAVGEGTGRPVDLDEFDDHYLHLFVWDDERGAVVGAYRIGRTDHLVSRFGAAGLYTHTLFELTPHFLGRVAPALELGRSFVRPEYQREFAPLMLLWKGIGQVVANDPRYARLIGAVSVSRDYATMSRQLLVTFLKAYRSDDALAASVAPRNPPSFEGALGDLPDLLTALGGSPDRCDDLVREIESGKRGMPVLLRQYLKLDAKVVGFNVDPAFADALDALMVVDLRRVDTGVLQKYLGRPGAARFTSFHQDRQPARDVRPPAPVGLPKPARA